MFYFFPQISIHKNKTSTKKCIHVQFSYLQIRYTGYRDRPQEERQVRFQNDTRTQGRTEIAFVASGTNLQLTFNNMAPYGHPERELDFDKEPNKVSIYRFHCIKSVSISQNN